jgi:hypothetical protein
MEAARGRPSERRLQLPSLANLQCVRGSRRADECDIGRGPLGWPRSLWWMT